MSWSLPALLRGTGGELLRWGAGPFGRVSTDSRTIRAGEVFLALEGPSHDGHAFVSAAVARGASGAIVARDVVDDRAEVAWIRVADGLRALGDLAAARRADLAGRVIGVTGSNGKTTTKEMIAAVLSSRAAKVGRSRANENNLVGLPQTLLGLDGDEEFVVLEMGMNHAGEIWRLTEIARPDVGVIANVGPAHLEGLGTLANIAAAKAELALGLPVGATLVVNGEDPWLRAIADAYPGPTVRTGVDGEVRAIHVEQADEGQRLVFEVAGRRGEAMLHCVGAHNASNALLAAAVGLVLGLDAQAIGAGLSSFRPPPMRLEAVLLPGGARLWNDAYNANPASMAAALEALAAAPARRRIAVLGEMWELGVASAELHRELGRKAAAAGVDRLVAVGGHSQDVVAGALAAGLDPARVARFDATRAAGEAVAADLCEGDLVLVKGSRGARMEEVVRRLGSAS